MSGRDVETRDRLLRTATRLFADHGFNRVTVRDISRTARANVAAVNYHFGNKLGLYGDVLRRAIAAMQSTTESAKREGEGYAPEEQFRRYVHIFVRALLSTSDDWIHRLIKREIENPTPALDALIDQALRPRIDYLSGVVSAIVGCERDDPRVLRVVVGVQAQTIAYLPNAIGTRLGVKAQLDEADIEALAGHIADFSIGGMRAIARSVTGSR